MSDKTALYALGAIGAYLFLSKQSSSGGTAPVNSYGSPFSQPSNGTRATAAGASAAAAPPTNSLASIIGAISSIFGAVGKAVGGGGGGVGGGGAGPRTSGGAGGAAPVSTTAINTPEVTFGEGVSGNVITDPQVGSTILDTNANFTDLFGSPYADFSGNNSFGDQGGQDFSSISGDSFDAGNPDYGAFGGYDFSSYNGND